MWEKLEQWRKSLDNVVICHEPFDEKESWEGKVICQVCGGNKAKPIKD
jgi:hypothetical protein